MPFAKNEATAKAMAQHYISSGQQPAIPTSAIWRVLRPLCANVPAWVDELVQRIEAEREVVGQAIGTDTAKARLGMPGQDNQRREYNITAPATPEAQQWAGWGTALKPALEPITMARKPLAGTVAANVLEHGTGALIVYGCRVEGQWSTWKKKDGTVSEQSQDSHAIYGQGMGDVRNPEHPSGRWPANLILTYPEDEYKLKDNITPQQLAKLAEWMNENA